MISPCQFSVTVFCHVICLRRCNLLEPLWSRWFQRRCTHTDPWLQPIALGWMLATYTRTAFCTHWKLPWIFITILIYSLSSLCCNNHFSNWQSIMYNCPREHTPGQFERLCMHCWNSHCNHLPQAGWNVSWTSPKHSKCFSLVFLFTNTCLLLTSFSPWVIS